MIKNLIQRWGVILATVILTLGSILLSIIVSIVAAAIFGTSVRLQDIAVAIVIPVLLIPFLTNATFPSLAQVHSAEETARLLATTDPLTMTINRKRFIEVLENEFARSQRYGEKSSVLLFDLDNFRVINETYGYQIGDTVLKTVSEICRAQMRRPDVLARLGNDEFACVLPHTSEVGAMEFAERLRINVAESALTVGEHQLEFTISVGVKTFDKETDVDGIMRAVVKALSDAKQQGKNRTVLSTNDLVLEKA